MTTKSAIEEWKKQGRSDEAIWGVENFMSGAGLRILSEPIEEIEKRIGQLLNVRGSMVTDSEDYACTRVIAELKWVLTLLKNDREVKCQRCNDNGCPACDGTKGSKYNPEPY